MKMNKLNPKHWAILIVSMVFSAIAVLIRYLKGAQKNDKVVIFYGHKLNGNLKSLFDLLNKTNGYRVYFLSLDKPYLKKITEIGYGEKNLLYGLNLLNVITAARANAFITSHGLHTFSIIKKLTDIKFVDVWHGIPYKGFIPADLAHLHDYAQVWVSSPLMKKMYVNNFGFNKNKVKVTGYGRVDQLLDGTLNKKQIIAKYNLPKAEKFILIAPTWKQDDTNRNILPFGTDKKKFFKQIDDIANRNKSVVIFRSHLNSSQDVQVPGLKSTIFMSYGKYEQAEDFLFIADILVTDWSSIAFDYLPLKRPTIFLDVEPPFKRGLSLGAEYRFGEVVADFNELKISLAKFIRQHKSYQLEYKDKIDMTIRAAYGSSLDGKSTQRYYKELEKLLSNA